MLKYLPLLFLVYCNGFFNENVSAQFVQHNYIEVGKTNVSDGVYLNAASLSKIEYKFLHAELGFLFPVTDFENYLNSIYTGIGCNFLIKELPFEINTFLTHKFVSNLIREWQIGIFAGLKIKHFNFTLGNNTRLFCLTETALEFIENENLKKLQIVEKRNLMYSVSYLLRTADSEWNIITTILNYDYFLINQETNPFVSLKFTYNPIENIRLYSEIIYKGAGFNNIRVNYFGMNLKTGILWQLDY